jgi:hypothetical protein
MERYEDEEEAVEKRKEEIISSHTCIRQGREREKENISLVLDIDNFAIESFMSKI